MVDPLLAKYARIVGNRRSPGTTPRVRPLGIGLRRAPLWSALVVSAEVG